MGYFLKKDETYIDLPNSATFMGVRVDNWCDYEAQTFPVVFLFAFTLPLNTPCKSKTL